MQLYVMVMKTLAGTERIKIGVSSSPEERALRLKKEPCRGMEDVDLSTLSVIYSTPTPSKKAAFAIEARVHRLLCKARVAGEVFDMNSCYGILNIRRGHFWLFQTCLLSHIAFFIVGCMKNGQDRIGGQLKDAR